MKYWLVIHNREAYLEEPTRIGKKANFKGKINKIKKGDKVLYYLTGESVILNSYNVTSHGYFYTPNNRHNKWWKNESFAYSISPRFKRMINCPLSEAITKSKLITFKNTKQIGSKLFQKTVIELPAKDFLAIEQIMKKYKPTKSDLFKGRANEGNLGTPQELEILNYAPTSEQGVVVLFAHFMRDLGKGFLKMEFVRSGFPDACVIQETGRFCERKYIEFEFKASMFRSHEKSAIHREILCDYIVCWENDYPNAPLEVIELKTVIPKILSLNHKKVA